jgi:Aspartyl protease
MPAYDSVSFDPPAPVARVVVRDPETGDTSDGLPAVLDTGADITLIPRSAAAEAGVSPIPGASYELAGFDRNLSRAESAHLDLLFLGKAIRGRFLLHDRDYGILGRDVLNLLSLLMSRRPTHLGHLLGHLGKVRYGGGHLGQFEGR